MVKRSEKSTKEEKERKMEVGDLEADVYSEEGREELIDEEDEITDIDEGFMKGYEEGERVAECSNCKKALGKEIVVEEFDDETFRFCSDDCAMEFAQKRVKED